MGPRGPPGPPGKPGDDVSRPEQSHERLPLKGLGEAVCWRGGVGGGWRGPRWRRPKGPDWKGLPGGEKSIWGLVYFFLCRSETQTLSTAHIPTCRLACKCPGDCCGRIGKRNN